MKKAEHFFVYTFIVSFLLCAVVMTGDYIGKQPERNFWGHSVEEWKDRQEAAADRQEEYENRQEDLIWEEEQDRGRQEELIWEKEQDGDRQEVSESREEHGNRKEEPTDTLPEDREPQEEGRGSVHVGEHAEGQPGQTDGESVKVPLTFETADYEYFEDALFIGDSRTVGIMEYGNIEKATFFADSGMSVFSLDKKKVSISTNGKVTFDEVLKYKQYGKIYLMLGINELGYRFDTFQAKYQETVAYIREQQRDAIIFLCANMHVTGEQSAKDDIYNNENVNRVNEMIAGLADNETVFYIDVNERFDDEAGSLSMEYSSDAFHVYGKYYLDWVDWLCTKAIVRPENS